MGRYSENSVVTYRPNLNIQRNNRNHHRQNLNLINSNVEINSNNNNYTLANSVLNLNSNNTSVGRRNHQSHNGNVNPAANAGDHLNLSGTDIGSNIGPGGIHSPSITINSHDQPIKEKHIINFKNSWSNNSKYQLKRLAGGKRGNAILSLNSRRSDKIKNYKSLLNVNSSSFNIPNAENKLKQLDQLLDLKNKLDETISDLRNTINKVDHDLPEHQRSDNFYLEEQKYVQKFGHRKKDNKKMPMELLNSRQNGIHRCMEKLKTAITAILENVIMHRNNIGTGSIQVYNGIRVTRGM